MDVMHWLRGLDLERYAPAFHAHNVDVTVLPDLTADDLAGLGVTSIGHRRKLLAAVAVLRAGTIAQAERRQVTIMFCDLVGSTALTSKLDPEDTREIMLHYQGAVSGEVIRFGGFVAKYMGDGVLVYFGYPRAHEDDAERAVRAGLKILAAMKRLRTPADEELQVRIGIATGQVVIGDLIGDGAAQERAVIGDASNIAARLQSSAAPGSIVVAGSTRQLLANLFHLRPLGPQAIKGFSEPIEAWTLAGALVTDTRFEAMRAGTRNAVFVGRKLEAGLLLDRQQQAWQGAGQVVLLSGEPGIGKSRLAAWLCDHITGEPHLLLRFQCSPYHRDSPLHPFAIQIERAADLQADDPSAHKLNKLEAVLAMGLPEPAAAVPPFAALLAIPLSDGCPSPALSPARQRQATFIAILDLIEALARRQPVLLLFEDAHWADATSIELIGLMCERVRALRILAIITFRPEVEPPWPQLPNVTRLVLDRLDQDAVISVVRQVAASRDLPEKMLQALVARADGNPLFAEELTKAALEAETLAGHPANRHVNGLPPQPAVPATLQDSLNDRLDRLTPGKEVAQIGAAIGRDFSYALLSRSTARGTRTIMARKWGAQRRPADDVQALFP